MNTFVSRIQKLPPVLWTELPLDNPFTYLFWYDKTNVKHYKKMPDAQTALEKVSAAEKAGMAAFASGPVPCNQNQHGVFAYNAAGCLKEYILAKNVNDMINAAYASVFGKTPTISRSASRTTSSTQIVAKDNKDVIMVAHCTFDNDDRVYDFITKEALFPGDRRTAHLKNGDYKPVNVKWTEITTISKLSHPIGWYVELCKFLLKEHELPAKEPEEYVERFDDGMKEAFTPVCDYVTKKDFDGYTCEQPDNNPPEVEDYDDLPE